MLYVVRVMIHRVSGAQVFACQLLHWSRWQHIPRKGCGGVVSYSAVAPVWDIASNHRKQLSMSQIAAPRLKINTWITKRVIICF
jgi:hypothetical protein